MKNFEKYLDDIAQELESAGCVLPGADCPNVYFDCTECFKRWAMEEAVDDK